MNLAASPWSIQGTLASVASGPWTFELDLTRPWQGWRGIAVAGRPLVDPAKSGIWCGGEGNLIGPEPCGIDEAYARGRDLVVHYARRQDNGLATSLSWRVLADDEGSARCADSPAALGIEWTISVQTDTLAAQPACRLVFDAPDAVLSIGPSRLSDSMIPPESERTPLRIDRQVDGPSWVEFVSDDPAWRAWIAVHPSDVVPESQGGLTGSEPRGFHPTLRLELMEKGVIRSARTRIWVFDSTAPSAEPDALMRAFLAADLPLTT